MNNKKSVMSSIIISDALTVSIDGFSKGHLHSQFKDLNSYIDTRDGLGGKMDKWKKPGLYSSISQLMIILALTASKKNIDISSFTDYISSSPDIPDHEYGIFRHPGSLERGFINSSMDNKGEVSPPSYSCCRIIPQAAPIAFIKCNIMKTITMTISYVLLFTRDTDTLAGTLLFTLAVKKLTEPGISVPADYTSFAAELCPVIINEINSSPEIIFDLAINPDTLTASLGILQKILTGIHGKSESRTAESMICSAVNTIFKTPVKRATVNHPFTIVPYAFFLCNILKDREDALFSASLEGGTVSCIVPIVSAILSSTQSLVLPDQLIKGLVNRKKILSILNLPESSQSSPGIIADFIESEKSLTLKEIEEHNALCRHSKQGSGKVKKKTRPEKDHEITRHVVESWTKIDKARWRKERKKQDLQKE